MEMRERHAEEKDARGTEGDGGEIVRYRVRPGGLMRCCLQTLDEHMDTATEAPLIGTVLSCRFCSRSSMIVAPDGTWEREAMEGKSTTNRLKADSL